MEWYTKDMVSTGTVNGYAFNYDDINRLTGSSFFNRNGSTVSWQDSQQPSNLNYGTITGIGSENGITYDKNGNIKTLVRKGKRNNEVVVFDSFTYHYMDDNGNKLKRVSDAVNGQNSLADFRNTAAPEAVNNYDQNGNLIADVDRNMTIQYNQLNLPVLVQFANGRINNTYRYDGVKTGKTVYDAVGRQTLSERYYGNLVLSNNAPARILHADGVIELSSTFQPTYYYHLKDHLGNVRAVVSPGSNNTTVVNQTNEYYPFGMAYTKSSSSLLNPVVPNKYKYNGKEEQEMPGKWLDYGARFYDTQLGRWHSVDPMTEKYESNSPYQYCLNNPITLIDPFGLDVVNAHEKKKQEAEKRKIEAQRKKDGLTGNEKSRVVRKINRELKRAESNLKNVDRLYQKSEQAINDLKENNPELYEKLDNLQDPGGTEVDGYDETVDNLETGVTDEFHVSQTADGLSSVKPDVDYGSYYSVKSKHGPNTVSIRLNSYLFKPGARLAHEGGHITYNVAFLKYYYLNWVLKRPKGSIGGHGAGNPSGINAIDEEKIYNKNAKKEKR